MANDLWLTEVGFATLVLVYVLERIFEMLLSRRNARQAKALGAIEVGQSHYPLMVLLPGAFFASMLLEVGLLRRPLVAPVAIGCCVFLALAMALRYWAIASLGGRWNTRVIVLPGADAIRRGPYRLIKHPNYLAVVIEIAALPLVHGAFLTALSFSVLNALLLRRRIRVEEDALKRHCDYAAVFEAPA